MAVHNGSTEKNNEIAAKRSMKSYCLSSLLHVCETVLPKTVAKLLLLQ